MYYNRPIKNHNIAMRIVPMSVVMSGLKCLTPLVFLYWILL